MRLGAASGKNVIVPVVERLYREVMNIRACRAMGIAVGCFAAPVWAGQTDQPVHAGPAATKRENPALEAIRADLHARGIETCDQGRWAEALPIHERLTRLDPDNGFGWMGLGWSRQHTGDFRGGIVAYERVLALGGFPAPPVMLRIAECHAQSGDLERAMEMLQMAVGAGLPNLGRVLAAPAFEPLRTSAALGPRFRELLNDLDARHLSRVEGWGIDLSVMEKEVHRLLYASGETRRRSGFDAGLATLRRRIEELSNPQVEAEIVRLMATLGDGHTLAASGDTGLIPVLLYEFSDGVYITGADAPHRDLVWARVLTVDGVEVADALARVAPMISRDNSMRVLSQGVALLRSPRLLNGIGVCKSERQLTMGVRDAGGVVREVALLASAAPIRAVRAPEGATATLPLHMQRRDELYWFQPLPDSRLVYFQYNGCGEMAGRPLAEFAPELIRAVEAPGVGGLVIDLRWNGGGDVMTSKPLLSALLGCRKLRERNSLFVITGRNTFSAAMVFATQLERYMQPVFVGEPTGSSPNFTGETNVFSLPYSRMKLSVSNLHWQTSTPNDRRTWIAPRIRTPMSFSAWKHGTDESLDAIRQFTNEDER